MSDKKDAGNLRVPDTKEGMLVYKNQRLAERVDEQRREIRHLEARIEEYDKQQEEYQETLVTVNRLWNQLNQDIVFLVARATGRDGFPGASSSGNGTGAGGDVEMSEAQPSSDRAGSAEAGNGPTPNGATFKTDNSDKPPDTFLQRLLRGAEQRETLAGLVEDAYDRQAQLADGYSDVETALRARMAGTSAALAVLVDALDTAQRGLSSAAAAMKLDPTGDEHATVKPEAGDGAAATRPTGNGEPPPDAGRGAQPSSPAGNAQQAQQQGKPGGASFDEVRAQLDVQRAIARAADENAKSLQGELNLERARSRQLETELADKIEAVALAQRKLAAARAGTIEASGGASGPSSGGQEVGVGGGAAEGQLEPGERVGDADGLMAAELQELRKLLEKRNAEVETSRAQVLKLQRELQGARAALMDEGHVLQTRLYQLAQKQLGQMGADLERMTSSMDGLQRELNIMQQTSQDLRIRAEGADFAKRALRDCESRIADLEAKHAAALAARNDVEMQLHRERERFGNARSVEELSVMVGTLQKENAVMKGHVARHKVAAERLEAAAREVAAAQALAETKQAAIGELHVEVEQQKGRVRQLEEHQKQLQATIGELRLFVEVLLRFCEDPRDVAEVRLQEAVLKKEVEQLRSKLKAAEEGAMPSVQQAQADASQARQQVSELRSCNEALKQECVGLRKELEALGSRVKELKEESEAYMGEIEAIGSAYEDMQAQNTRLLAGITERDEFNNKLTAEKMRAQQQHQVMATECHAATARAQSAETQAEGLKRRVQDMEGQLQEALSAATAARDSLRTQGNRAEAMQRDLREKEDQMCKAHVLLESAQRQAADRKRGLEEEQERLQRERAKRQRLDEDCKLLQAKVAKLRGQSDGAEAPRELQEEVQGLRSLLRCSVCSSRRKDTIITKCYHMFCSHCIQRNLETRHRKCPGCNVGFGTNDVKSIYFS